MGSAVSKYGDGSGGKRWSVILFGGVFLCIGLAVLLLSMAPAIVDGARMSQWTETRATLESVDRISNKGSMRIEARYRYAAYGATYQGTRVSVHSGSDDIGSFQENLARELERSKASSEPVVA